MPMRADTFSVWADVASSEAAPGDAAMRREEGAAVTATRPDWRGALVPTAANAQRLYRPQGGQWKKGGGWGQNPRRRAGRIPTAAAGAAMRGEARRGVCVANDDNGRTRAAAKN